MTGKVIRYCAGGNTARGFRSYFDSNLADLDRVYILKGAPGTGKSNIMKTIGDKYWNKGYDIEFIHCSFDTDAVDGVIIPALSVGIVDGNAPHVIEPKAAGAIEQYVNLGDAWDTEKLKRQKTKIQKLRANIDQCFLEAHRSFQAAHIIHDEWEKIYISNMDFNKADEIAAELIETFFGEMKLNKRSRVRHRYLGGATPKGAIDFVPNITSGLSKRYFIKGRAGSGKSTMLKKIAAVGEHKGFDMEIYHCGFDPNSLDMVIFRELGVAIFDSTAPHEYFPDRENDEIIDIYERAIKPGTDEERAEQIREVSGKYRGKMNQATYALAEAKRYHDQLKEIYASSVDRDKVASMQLKIESEIDRLAETADETGDFYE